MRMILHHRAIIERHQELAGPKIGDLPPKDAPGVPPLRDQMMDVVAAGVRARQALVDDGSQVEGGGEIQEHSHDTIAEANADEFSVGDSPDT